jgi:DNA-directed RNA polymerase sigma subunit (sigma70/sigma32)
MEPTRKQELKAWAKRRAAMRRLRDKGWTLTAIGQHYGISKQRAGQLIQAGR